MAMHPTRLHRLLLVVGIVCVSSVIVALSLYAFKENINLFYPPVAVSKGEVPVGLRVRVGGLLKQGSLTRDDTGLNMSFVVTDGEGEVTVRYSGLVPDLFGEGRGVVVTGMLGSDGIFMGEYILAKHDENYMPPNMPLPHQDG